MAAYVYITAIVGVILLVMFWVIFDEGFSDYLFPDTLDKLANDTNNSTIGARAAVTIRNMSYVWIGLPVLILVMIMYWAYTESQKIERGYYP